MTNFQDKQWVVKALTFWESAKPNKFANRKLINWNIAMLQTALKRLS